MEAGKIYWLLGDFKFLNRQDPDRWEYVAKLEKEALAVSAELIRFYTAPSDFDTEDLIGYSVELRPTRDSFYEGIAKNSDSGEKAADVTCELFENPKRYLLKGTWIEEGEDGELFFTWILIINKDKK